MFGFDRSIDHSIDQSIDSTSDGNGQLRQEDNRRRIWEVGQTNVGHGLDCAGDHFRLEIGGLLLFSIFYRIYRFYRFLGHRLFLGVDKNRPNERIQSHQKWRLGPHCKWCLVTFSRKKLIIDFLKIQYKIFLKIIFPKKTVYRTSDYNGHANEHADDFVLYDKGAFLLQLKCGDKWQSTFFRLQKTAIT